MIGEDRGLFLLDIHEDEFEKLDKEIKENFCKLAADTKAQDRYANHLLSVYLHPIVSSYDLIKQHHKAITTIYHPLDPVYVGKEKTEEQIKITINWMAIEVLLEQVKVWKETIETHVKNFSPEVFNKIMGESALLVIQSPQPSQQSLRPTIPTVEYAPQPDKKKHQERPSTQNKKLIVFTYYKQCLRNEAEKFIKARKELDQKTLERKAFDDTVQRFRTTVTPETIRGYFKNGVRGQLYGEIHQEFSNLKKLIVK